MIIIHDISKHQKYWKFCFLIKGLLFEEKQHYLKQSCINYKLGWGDEI